MVRKRLPEALALVFLVLAAAGCSRLSFIKPSAKSNYEPERRTYRTQGTRESRRNEEARLDLSLATRSFRNGDLDAAEQGARAALRGTSVAPDAHTLLAIIAGRRDKLDEAAVHYRAALDAAPDKGAYLNNYGVWLCESGQPAESLAYFDRALQDRTYRSPVSALANAGSCAMKAGDPVRAERDLRAALEIEPENAKALESLAELLESSGRYFDSRAFLERRLAAAPATAAALQLAVRIETALGDARAAERYRRRLQAEFPAEDALQTREASSP